MSRPRTVTLPSGHRYALVELKRIIAEQRPAPAEQPTLFPLIVDARPRGERTAAERYEAPSLFSALAEPEQHQCPRCRMTVPDARGIVHCWHRDCPE